MVVADLEVGIAVVVVDIAAGWEVGRYNLEVHLRVGESKSVEADWGNWVRQIWLHQIYSMVVVLRLEPLVLLRTCLGHRPNT